MASATGIPPNVAAARGQSEEEPLLGRRGDASQPHGQPLYHNLWIGTCRESARRLCTKREIANRLTGTAPIAQAGIWIVSAPRRHVECYNKY